MDGDLCAGILAVDLRWIHTQEALALDPSGLFGLLFHNGLVRCGLDRRGEEEGSVAVPLVQ
jgi:hypothetical protein